VPAQAPHDDHPVAWAAHHHVVGGGRTEEHAIVAGADHGIQDANVAREAVHAAAVRRRLDAAAEVQVEVRKQSATMTPTERDLGYHESRRNRTRSIRSLSTATTNRSRKPLSLPPSLPVCSEALAAPRDEVLAMAAENYWRYAEARQQQQAMVAPAQTAQSVAAAAAMNPQQAAAPPLKRARPGFGGSSPLPRSSPIVDLAFN
jgi:hypothetical protein